jgi:hypothetical protein
MRERRWRERVQVASLTWSLHRTPLPTRKTRGPNPNATRACGTAQRRQRHPRPRRRRRLRHVRGAVLTSMRTDREARRTTCVRAATGFLSCWLCAGRSSTRRCRRSFCRTPQARQPRRASQLAHRGKNHACCTDNSARCKREIRRTYFRAESINRSIDRRGGAGQCRAGRGSPGQGRAWCRLGADVELERAAPPPPRQGYTSRRTPTQDAPPSAPPPAGRPASSGLLPGVGSADPTMPIPANRERTKPRNRRPVRFV